MPNAEKILLACDVDATLAIETLEIPKRNIEAINAFTEEGGLFVIATGRSPRSTKRFWNQINACPRCVIFNGAGIYDFKTDTLLWKNMLKKEDFLPIIIGVRNRFPNVGIEFWHEGGIYQMTPGFDNTARETVEGIKFLEATTDMLPDECFKMLLSCKSETAEVNAFCSEIASENVNVVCSSAYYCEILSSTSTKGAALKKLVEMTAPDAFVAAIGDYNNDVEMLSYADFSAAPENAVEEAKNAADIIVCDCHVGAVADIIEHLKNKNTEVL